MTKQWFASGGGIARYGPFKKWQDAVKAMRLIQRPAETRIRWSTTLTRNGVKIPSPELVEQPAQNQLLPEDIKIWSEEK